ncbi:MAG: MATE family efflux transporter [Chitinophagaceae bacterium]
MASNTLQLQVGTNYKSILRIALPIAFSIFIPQLNFITNNIFLGGLSQQALAIAGITGVYYLIFAVIGSGLNNGLQTLISRRAGENNTTAIGQIFHHGVVIALIMSAVGIILTYLLAPTVLSKSLRNSANVDTAIHFLYIRIWGLPFLYIYQMRNALLVGTNNSKLLVLGTLAETIINIVLDYTLIYGKLGMPRLGFNGAAYASIIAEAGGLLVIFAVMRWKGLSKQLQLFKKIQWQQQYLQQILTISAPLVLQYAISIISWEFFYILIEHHGEQDLAISNIMRNVFGLFGCMCWAFAATSNSMVSNVIGQKKHKEVLPLIWRLVKLSTGFSLIVCLLLNALPSLFLGLYGQNASFVSNAIPVLRIVSSALLMMSIATIFLNAVVGTGNSKLNLFTETAAIIVYCAYAYYVLEYLQLSIVWGWASEWLYWIVMFIPSFWYIRSNRWQHKTM